MITIFKYPYFHFKIQRKYATQFTIKTELKNRFMNELRN